MKALVHLIYKITVMTCFCAITVFCAYSFGAALFATVSAISHDSLRVVFDQGAFYLLGATIGLLALIWIMIYQGILTAFILPIVSHVIIEEIVFDRGYELCSAETSTWFYLSEIVYLKTGSDCLP